MSFIPYRQLLTPSLTVATQIQLTDTEFYIVKLDSTDNHVSICTVTIFHRQGIPYLWSRNPLRFQLINESTGFGVELSPGDPIHPDPLIRASPCFVLNKRFKYTLFMLGKPVWTCCDPWTAPRIEKESTMTDEQELLEQHKLAVKRQQPAAEAYHAYVRGCIHNPDHQSQVLKILKSPISNEEKTILLRQEAAPLLSESFWGPIPHHRSFLGPVIEKYEVTSPGKGASFIILNDKKE